MSITKIFTSQNLENVTAFQLTRVDAFKYVFKENGLCSAFLAFFVGRKVERAEVEQWDGGGSSSIHSKLTSLLKERQIEVSSPDCQKGHSQPTATEKSARRASAMCVQLKTVNEDIIKENEALNVENARLRSDNDSAIKANQKLKDTREIEEEMMCKLKNMETKVSERRKVLSDIVHKTSAALGRALTYDNPSVVTLNNPSRAPKLVDGFHGLYNDDWSDIMEDIIALEGKNLSVYSPEDKSWHKVIGHSRHEKSKMMAILLYNIFHKLHDDIKVLTELKLAEIMKENKSKVQEEEERQIAYKKEHGDIDEGKPFEKKTPVLREGDAYSIMLENISDYGNDIKAINDAVKEEFLKFDENILDGYINKLSSLLFKALSRKPSLYFDFNEASDDFNKEVMKPFTYNGSKIDFMVWPVIYLSEDGALLANGVAQLKND